MTADYHRVCDLQRFPDGLASTSVGNMDQLATSFPTFLVNQTDASLQLGMLAYAKTFFCLNNVLQRCVQSKLMVSSSVQYVSNLLLSGLGQFAPTQLTPYLPASVITCPIALTSSSTRPCNYIGWWRASNSVCRVPGVKPGTTQPNQLFTV